MFYLIPTMDINDVVSVIHYVNSTNSFHNHSFNPKKQSPLTNLGVFTPPHT
jgi:hypothetical protein